MPAVPASAVIRDESKTFVFVYQDGKAVRQEVELGPLQGTLYAVTGGLKEGDTVIVTGQHRLKENEPVSVELPSAKPQQPEKGRTNEAEDEAELEANHGHRLGGQLACHGDDGGSPGAGAVRYGGSEGAEERERTPSFASIQTDAAAFMKSVHGIEITVERVIYGQQDNGRQVAAVFQLKNSSGKRVRIPDYELAVRMASGAEAAMEPSAGSPRFLMPGQTAEWRWMSRTLAEESAPVRFIWKETDREVYPAKVTVLGGMPIRDVWENDYSPMTDPEMVKPWGQPFQLDGPAGASMLIFTPLSIVKSSGKPEQTTERAREKLDTVHIVTLRVENRNNISEKLPEFTLTAWSDTAIYDAKRLGQPAPPP